MHDRPVDASAAPRKKRGRRALLFKMYGTLRNEIEAFLKEIGVLITFGLLASGAVWGWILVNQDKVVSKGLLFIPAVLAVLLGLRAHALREGTKRANEHLARIEEEFGIEERLAWHARWEKELPSVGLFSRSAWERNALGPWLYVFWVSIVLLNAVPAVLLCLSP